MAASLATERPAVAEAPRSRSRARWAKLFKEPVALLAALVLVGVVGAAVLAPVLTPHDPLDRQIVMRLKPPGWTDSSGTTYLLGTDEMGRDVLTRLLYGARVSLIVGLAVPLVAGAVGVVLGLVAGFWGGRAEKIIMTLVDIFLTFPFLLLALSLVGVLGTGLGNIIVVLGLTGWPIYARLVRGQTLAVRERDFVLAARALGVREAAIAFRHVLPNLLSSIIVLTSLQTGTAIISESSLSFLGLGIPSPTPSWGTMLADGRPYVETAWWLAAFPGLAILLTTLATNVLGDRIRDVLDPKLQI